MDTRLNYESVKFKDDGRLKLLIIVGTRPEIIRLAAVIEKCRKYFDCILAHTGQNYDYNLNGVFIRDLKLGSPEVHMNAAGDDLGATVGNIINCSPGRVADFGRYEFLPFGNRGEAVANSRVSYGGGEQVQRRVPARREQFLYKYRQAVPRGVRQNQHRTPRIAG